MTTAAADEIVIVGGGLVGASLALALSGGHRRVTLLEAAAPSPSAPRWDERCIALNAASQQVFAQLGVWPAIAEAATPIVATHISERGRFGMARFTADEAGLPALGYNVPVRHLMQVLWQALTQTAVVLRAPAEVVAHTVEADRVVVQLADDPAPLNAALMIAADGAQSPLRAAQGVAAQTDDYGQTAMVTAVRVQRPHRGWAYERFTPDGPIALLPKPDDACSLVWTLPTAQAATLMAADDATLLAAAQQCFGERLGRFQVLGARAAWPLARTLSAALTGPRTVFLGNAAQSLHPVAAQGFNLGLRDVAALAAALRAHDGDAGDAALLTAYARDRQPDRDRTAGFTDRLVRLFSNRLPGLAATRHWGLLALDLLPPLKQPVMWQNLGFGGSR
ncbi:2-octaprenyl-6-methoxyphenyl hydroxylase [Flagellatimonas centrodinii]|uniref:2-octaprenyl-6-methoxyphenyl hydroxylase n=1 Tax=Flagellatimonas centrodinii TaxID=2806210 RepID=UPI001FEF94C0|nr:2-octaprenyl-6-methoxyphenyl hydroxylase [Flagellatimonas centrodinii]ULQ45586.1 2-octaprenyl-6-methoxyphenyl hydroxylase [Flagellatimonas centrodinii]